jgi:hypothetical protein
MSEPSFVSSLRSRVFLAELLDKRFFMAPNATEIIEIIDVEFKDIGFAIEAMTLHWKFYDVDSNFRCKVTYSYSYDGQTWSQPTDLGASFWAVAATRGGNTIETAVTDVTTFGRHIRFKFHFKSNAAAETFATISAAVAIKTYGQ